MKILQVSKLYHPWIGGVEKIVQQISEGLKDNFDITVLCCQSKGKGKKEKINGIDVLKTSSFGIFWGMPISISFLRVFKKIMNNFDVIDYHYPFPLADLAIFLFNPEAKLVVHYHSDIVRQQIFSFLIRPLTLNTLKQADKIIVSNPNMIETSPCLRKFKDKCKVIPFGVDCKKFKKDNQKKIKEVKRNYGEFILFVGRLGYYKGVRYLVRAMKEIDSNLVIVGKGPQKKKLKKEIKKLDLEDKIFFLPFMKKEDLINFYKASKLFVLPSIFKSEAFGIVLIEALACGTPLISTELGTGTSYVNKDGVTGFVVSPKDKKDLSFVINKLLNNEKLYKKIKKNTVRRVKDLFSLEKMLEKNKRVYKN